MHILSHRYSAKYGYNTGKLPVLIHGLTPYSWSFNEPNDYSPSYFLSVRLNGNDGKIYTLGLTTFDIKVINEALALARIKHPNAF